MRESFIQVGEGDDIVAQVAVGDAAFWVSPGGADGPRFSPQAIGGATGRTLLVADDPDALFAQAVAAGAIAASGIADEHGWHLGRIFDPFGHDWETGRPLGAVVLRDVVDAGRAACCKRFPGYSGSALASFSLRRHSPTAATRRSS